MFAGALSVAVPGEIAGYWEAHKKFGKLPWSDLIQPSIEICENGYNLTQSQYKGLQEDNFNINDDPTLKSVICIQRNYLLKYLLKPRKTNRFLPFRHFSS